MTLKDIRDRVMLCKLSTGESVIGFLGKLDTSTFMIGFPYEFKDGRISSEYCSGTLNRVFLIPLENLLFAKSLKEYHVSEYFSLCYLDNDDVDSFIEQFLERFSDEPQSKETISVNPSSMVH
jgi:hypothetical protein